MIEFLFIFISLFAAETSKIIEKGKEVKPLAVDTKPLEAALAKQAVPIIPPELEIRYLRITVEKQFLKTQLEASMEKEKKVTQEIIDACGKDYTPQEKERLICVKKEK